MQNSTGHPQMKHPTGMVGDHKEKKRRQKKERITAGIIGYIGVKPTKKPSAQTVLSGRFEASENSRFPA